MTTSWAQMEETENTKVMGVKDILRCVTNYVVLSRDLIIKRLEDSSLQQLDFGTWTR